MESLELQRSGLILASLLEAPLLVENLPEAKQLSRKDFTLPSSFSPLNFRQKLGHLYEDALAVLLRHSPRYELLVKNLQLQKSRQETVGELDFLLRDLKTGKLIHLELATKFYLAVATESEVILPGPDPRDNYSNKLDRLRSHQLTLTRRHPETLPAEFREEKIEVKQLAYGCLFDHFQSEEKAEPCFTNHDCRRGKWLTENQLMDSFPDEKKGIIPKPLWPVDPLSLEFSSLDPWLPETNHSRCVMIRIENQQSPFFVTPNSYPTDP